VQPDAPYSVLSRPCIEALPASKGDPVRPDAMDLHAACDGTACLHAPLGPYKPGDPCMCQCHTPEGLPDWRKPAA
jgi:hypothetical protein